MRWRPPAHSEKPELDLRGARTAARCGCVLMLCGWLFYRAPLFFPGVGLLALAAFSTLWIRAAARDVEVTRELDRRRVLEGGTIHASLHSTGGRFGLPGLQSDDLISDVVKLRRGIHHFGPPAVTISDPFGLAVAHCHGRGSGDDVIVLPATDSMNWRGSELRKIAGGPLAAGHQEPWGAGDVDSLRVYRHGTPASRIHWPALARGTGLLERKLVADHEQLPLLVLDNRCDSGPEGEAALDAAVRTTASLTLAMARSGGCNLLLPGTRHPAPISGDLVGWPSLHARMALVKGAELDSATPMPRSRKGGLIRVAAQHPASRPASRGRELLIVPEAVGPRHAWLLGDPVLSRPRASSRGRERALSALLPFCLLASVAAARWSTMLHGVATVRWIGLILVATIVAAGRLLPRRFAWLLTLVGVIAAIPVAGFPLSWVTDLRIAVFWSAVHGAINELHTILIPYGGSEQSIRSTLVLIAGLLLICGAALFACTRRRWSALVASAPLLLAAAVPSAIYRPHSELLIGALLLALVALLTAPMPRRLWRAPATVVLLAVSVLVALALTPTLDPGNPLVNFTTLASHVDGQTAGAETFDWAQDYGPVPYPQTGATVLTVQARIPSFWKTEDLDSFEGFGWVQVPIVGQNPTAGISRSSLKRYTQELTVTVGGMSTSDVVAAGIAARPSLPGAVSIGDPGSWTLLSPLEPGDQYHVQVYTPEPSAAEMAHAGTKYPRVIQEFAAPPLPTTGVSQYTPAINLAQQLQAGTSTPYAYAENIIAYLRSHETYSLNPPLVGNYPLLQFLFVDHRGYCQQFAGAMALLLRIGGVPARVATGFATGNYNSATHAYTVSDNDAHAWVEIWFPGYGWVQFNPTPGPGDSSGPTGGSAGSTPRTRGKAPRSALLRSRLHGDRTGRPTVPGKGRSTSYLAWLALAGALLIVLAGVGLLGLRRGGPASTADLLEELELAFARLGEPLRAGMTLTELQVRVRGAPTLVTYIGALRDARYASASALPATVTVSGRRALRRWLTRGEGIRMRLLALLAVPPWRPVN
jgi:transglutaminase-like putative cysteine protease/uncharacterized protein (DUF58 family)